MSFLIKNERIKGMYIFHKSWLGIIYKCVIYEYLYLSIKSFLAMVSKRYCSRLMKLNSKLILTNFGTKCSIMSYIVLLLGDDSCKHG